jgi:uncharacterized delta-60 repeat protein
MPPSCLVAVRSDESFLRRYLTAGKIDPAFGVGGTLRLSSVRAWSLPTVATDPIVVALSTETEGTYLVRRYSADGVLDSSFGTGGEVTVSFPLSHAGPTIAVSPTGSVTVGVTRLPANPVTMLTRVTSSGAIDSTFGTAGTAVLDGVTGSPVGFDGAGALMLHDEWTDGVATSIVRVTASGTIDSDYGEDGFARLNGNLGFTYGVVDSDGAVTAVSRNVGPGYIARVQRLTPAGDADTSFGDGGVTDLMFLPLQPDKAGNSNEFGWPREIVALDGGRVGVLLNSFGASAAAVLLADGSPDPDFGVGGQAILSDDLQLVAGSIRSDGDVEFLGAVPNTRPLYLQRSVGGSPWPPVAPAPDNLVVTPTFGSGFNPGFTATWSPVVNPDPEVVEYGYEISVARAGDDPYRWETDTTTAELIGLEPGRYTITVRSLNMYTAGQPARATLVIPELVLDVRPAGRSYSAAVRLACSPTGSSAPVIKCSP